MNFKGFSQSALILATYSALPMKEQRQTLINYDYKQHIEYINTLKLFKKNKAKLKLNHIIEPIAFDRYQKALNIIFKSDEKYKVGIEFTNDKTIFITGVFDEIDVELHIELYFSDGTKNTFFALYEGNDMIDTGIYPFDSVKSKIEEALKEISKQPLFI